MLGVQRERSEARKEFARLPREEARRYETRIAKPGSISELRSSRQ